MRKSSFIEGVSNYSLACGSVGNEMTQSNSLLERLINELEQNPEMRRQLQEILLRDYSKEGEPSLLKIIHDMLQEIKQLRIDMNRRFEAVDKRFEEMDRRFEALIAEMNRRFEAVDKRFEEMMTAFHALRRDVAAVSTRYGLRLEDIFRDVFREALSLEGIKPESIRRLVVLDPDGEVVEPGEVTDLDIYMHDSECVAIEVKSRIDSHDIRRFEKTIRLAEKQEGIKVTKRIIITLYITPEDRLKAERKGIKVITSDRT